MGPSTTGRDRTMANLTGYDGCALLTGCPLYQLISAECRCCGIRPSIIGISNGACQHLTPSGRLGPAAGLLICGDQDGDAYLHSCDQDWIPLADTWHASVAAAKRQAEFEYVGSSATWLK